MYGLLDGKRSRLARAGLAFAVVAELCALVSVVGLFLGPAEWSPTGDTVTVLTPFITLSALGSTLGLLLVGIAVRQTASLPGWWKNVPMFLALSVIPLIASSAVFKAINEWLFELPTLLIGLEWIALGGSHDAAAPLGSQNASISLTRLGRPSRFGRSDTARPLLPNPRHTAAVRSLRHRCGAELGIVFFAVGATPL